MSADRADAHRAGQITIEDRAQDFVVKIPISADVRDEDWLTAFENPVIEFSTHVRKGTIVGASIEIPISSEEQLEPSVRYAEEALNYANRVYNQKAEERARREEEQEQARADREERRRSRLEDLRRRAREL